MKANDWTNKRVLITGGSSGLGAALAKQLGTLGAQVLIVGRGSAALESASINSAAEYVVADVSSPQDVHTIAAVAHQLFGGVDVLINNASALGPTPLGPLMDLPAQAFEEVLQTNLLGPFRLTKAVLAGMLLGQGGQVINISSDAAREAYATWGAYSVSKAALDHLTRIWAEELAGRGIRFLAVDPGDMDTPMHAAAIPDANPDELYNPAEVAADLIAFVARESHSHVRYSAEEWRQAS